jgi:hypothetical protein
MAVVGWDPLRELEQMADRLNRVMSRATGSGFAIGSKEDCGFKVGDHVKIEASDTETATTIQQVSSAEHKGKKSH